MIRTYDDIHTHIHTREMNFQFKKQDNLTQC